jgi:hypothetical protein
VGTFSGAIAADPDNAPLRRHRGHRHLTRRNFTLAEADLSMAVELMDKSPGRAPQWEADGQPNALNIPLSTLQFNAYYHLGLARYLQGDFGGALAAYQACYNYSGINDESLQATAYWRCTAMRPLTPMRAGTVHTNAVRWQVHGDAAGGGQRRRGERVSQGHPPGHARAGGGRLPQPHADVPGPAYARRHMHMPSLPTALTPITPTPTCPLHPRSPHSHPLRPQTSSATTPPRWTW